MTANHPHGTEQILHDERSKNNHSKEVLMKQLDGFMRKDMESTACVRELEIRYHDSINETENLRRENAKLKEDFLSTRDELKMKEARFEDRSRGNDF